MKPKCMMLVGLPGCGKSTYTKKFLSDKDSTQWRVISSDNHLEQFAVNNAITYNEAFQTYVDKAAKLMNADVAHASAMKQNIIWDQTNLTSTARMKKMKQLKGYEFVAVYFVLPEPEEWKRRLGSRPGKTIHGKILDNMRKIFEIPQLSEGFSEVKIV